MNSVTLKPNREKATLGFHPWIFSGAIASVTPGTRDGDIVAIHRYRGGQIATGYYNSKSSIAIRILAWGALPPDMDDLVTSRISEAIARRHGIMDDRSNACRLIFSEGDCLPGLIVDQYAGYLVVQFLTLGMDRLRDRVIEALQSLLSPVGIYERSDAASRKKDGLDPSCGLLAGAQIPDDLEIMVQGCRFLVDSVHGHKTGFYLDQRENWQIVASMAQGRSVLNCFSFSGAFGIFATAAGAGEVINVDTSASALALAEKQVALNRLAPATCVRADVFQQLREYERLGIKFDLIILDPPKLAASRRDLIAAARAYKDLNRVAMGILTDGGVLATFSCSEAMDTVLFDQVTWEASVEAGIQMNRLSRLSQSVDHPVLLSFPEGHYLKGLLLQKR